MLDFEQALAVAKIVQDDENGIISLTEFLFRPKKKEKEISYNLACNLATGNDLMRNTLYQSVIRNLKIMQCEKAYNMKG